MFSLFKHKVLEIEEKVWNTDDFELKKFELTEEFEGICDH